MSEGVEMTTLRRRWPSSGVSKFWRAAFPLFQGPMGCTPSLVLAALAVPRTESLPLWPQLKLWLGRQHFSQQQSAYQGKVGCGQPQHHQRGSPATGHGREASCGGNLVGRSFTTMARGP